MTATSLAGTVQESKAQRQERLKTRFRDRGGIFVPSEGNSLADILLAREVNGESPVKKRTPRRSALTPKPRPSTASRAARTTKAPRTGTSKRAARKSAAVPSEGDENDLPPARKRRDTMKTPKLQKGKAKRINDIDGGTPAGPSRSRAATQRKPFAVQLADAINSAMQTVPDSCSLAPGALPLPGKSERALGKCKANPVAVLPPRYSAELDPFGGCAVKMIKSPLVLALERQQREKQDGQREFAAQESEQANGAEVKEMKPPLLHDSDSDVPPTKMLAQAPQKKRRSRSKVKAEPPRTTSHTGVDSGGAGKKVQVLQEKKAPRKRKGHAKAPLDKDGDNDDDEQTHGPPNKRRRADPTTASRGRKENKEMSRSAREASVKVKMDKPLPSPVKQSARARPKPASTAKAKTMRPSSCADVSAARGTRPRGLPPDVRRRIKVIARIPPAIDDVDDPIDFLS